MVLSLKPAIHGLLRIFDNVKGRVCVLKLCVFVKNLTPYAWCRVHHRGGDAYTIGVVLSMKVAVYAGFRVFDHENDVFLADH